MGNQNNRGDRNVSTTTSELESHFKKLDYRDLITAKSDSEENEKAIKSLKGYFSSHKMNKNSFFTEAETEDIFLYFKGGSEDSFLVLQKDRYVIMEEREVISSYVMQNRKSHQKPHFKKVQNSNLVKFQIFFLHASPSNILKIKCSRQFSAKGVG